MKIGDIFNPKGLFYGAHVPNWLLRRKEINGCAKLVWGRLYQYCNDDGRAFPKLETLSEEIGFSVSGIKKAITELETVGLIRVEDHFGTHDSSDYYFLWHEWIEEGAAVVRAPREPQSSSRGSHKVAPARVTKEPPREPQSDSPLNESQREESQAIESVEGRPPPAPGASLPTLARDPAPPTANVSVKNSATVEPGADEEDPVARMARAKVTEARAKLATDAVQEQKQKKRLRNFEREQLKKRRLQEERDAGHEIIEPESSPVTRLERVWFEEFRKMFPDIPAARKWGLKQRSQIKQVLDLYDDDQVEVAIVFLISNWKSLREKLFKGRGDATPGVGVLLVCHDSLMPNATIWMKHRETLQQYAEYNEDPNEDRPYDLEQRYLAARKELAALGLS